MKKIYLSAVSDESGYYCNKLLIYDHYMLKNVQMTFKSKSLYIQFFNFTCVVDFGIRKEKSSGEAE